MAVCPLCLAVLLAGLSSTTCSPDRLSRSRQGTREWSGTCPGIRTGRRSSSLPGTRRCSEEEGEREGRQKGQKEEKAELEEFWILGLGMKEGWAEQGKSSIVTN